MYFPHMKSKSVIPSVFVLLLFYPYVSKMWNVKCKIFNFQPLILEIFKLQLFCKEIAKNSALKLCDNDIFEQT